jgi:hypothetical protein
MCPEAAFNRSLFEGSPSNVEGRRNEAAGIKLKLSAPVRRRSLYFGSPSSDRIAFEPGTAGKVSAPATALMCSETLCRTSRPPFLSHAGALSH